MQQLKGHSQENHVLGLGEAERVKALLEHRFVSVTLYRGLQFNPRKEHQIGIPILFGSMFPLWRFII